MHPLYPDIRDPYKTMDSSLPILLQHFCIHIITQFKESQHFFHYSLNMFDTGRHRRMDTNIHLNC